MYTGFKQVSNRRKRMPFVSQCIKNLKVLPKCDSVLKRQKLGVNFAVPFCHVCFQTMENTSVTHWQWMLKLCHVKGETLPLCMLLSASTKVS